MNTRRLMSTSRESGLALNGVVKHERGVPTPWGRTSPSASSAPSWGKVIRLRTGRGARTRLTERETAGSATEGHTAPTERCAAS